MGRFANEVPTPENVWEVIARLKPNKRARWAQEAAATGYNFPEYVIARIRANILKRRSPGDGVGRREVLAGVDISEDRDEEQGRDSQHWSAQGYVPEQGYRFEEGPQHDSIDSLNAPPASNNGQTQTPPTTTDTSPSTSSADAVIPELSASCRGTVGIASSPIPPCIDEEDSDVESLSSVESDMSAPMTAWSFPKVQDFSESVIVELDDGEDLTIEGNISLPGASLDNAITIFEDGGEASESHSFDEGGDEASEAAVSQAEALSGSRVQTQGSAPPRADTVQPPSQPSAGAVSPKVSTQMEPQPSASPPPQSEPPQTRTQPSDVPLPSIEVSQNPTQPTDTPLHSIHISQDRAQPTTTSVLHNNTFTANATVISETLPGQPFTPARFELQEFTTQQLEAEVVRRKRKREHEHEAVRGPQNDDDDGNDENDDHVHRGSTPPSSNGIEATTRARRACRAFLDHVLIPADEQELALRQHIDLSAMEEDSPNKRVRQTHSQDGVAINDDAEHTDIQPSQTAFDICRQQLTQGRATPPQQLQPQTTQFDGQEEVTDPFQPPPSGGAASRAAPFDPTISFINTATAPEAAADTPLNSPFITAANSPTQTSNDDHPESIPIMSTQQWQDIMDSSQVQAFFGPALPAAQPSSSLGRQGGEVQIGAADVAAPAASPPKRWSFDVENIPPHATAVWCVRKGDAAGFFFSEPPWLAENATASTYQTFEFVEDDAAAVMAQAVRYMNHEPLNCLPIYKQCYDESRAAIPESPSQQLVVDLAAASHPVHPRPHACAVCNVPLKCLRALLCSRCSSGPSRDPLLADCVKAYELCEEQAEILQRASRGRNIFYTGAAGTGKSVVLRAIRAYLQSRRIAVDVVSPTAITALNVDGRTIYSYAGWTPKNDEFPRKKLERHASRDRTWKRLTATETLVIEEISMVSNFTFTRLDWIMRAARKVDQPFGGAQLIVTGDFFQLPPVKPWAHCTVCGLPTTQDLLYRTRVDCATHGAFFPHDKFAFSSPAWDQCRFEHVELTTIHRQSDPVFTTMLNKVRIGVPLSSSEDKMLRAAGSEFDISKAVKLKTRRAEVQIENSRHLDRLDGPLYSFQCLDNGYHNESLHPDLEGSWARVDPQDDTSPYTAYSAGETERHRLDDEMELKLGMPVILLTNLYQHEGVANGSQGKIIHFEEHNERLLPRAGTHAGDKSRWGELLLSGRHASYQESNIRQYAKSADIARWPVVQFNDGPIVTIHPYCEVQELGIALTECTQEDWSLRSRTQIPLLPGWSITIHKSQGMTLDRAALDLFAAWEPGHVYTAMSRVRALDGLKITSMGSGKALRADEVVKRFYEERFGGEAGGRGR